MYTPVENFLKSSPKEMLIDFLERKGEKERNIDRLPPVCAPTGHQTCNLGMGPDLGSNLQHFGVWDNTLTN